LQLLEDARVIFEYTDTKTVSRETHPDIKKNPPYAPGGGLT
jgi:hypothetical protein